MKRIILFCAFSICFCQSQCMDEQVRLYNAIEMNVLSSKEEAHSILDNSLRQYLNGIGYIPKIDNENIPDIISNISTTSLRQISNKFYRTTFTNCLNFLGLKQLIFCYPHLRSQIYDRLYRIENIFFAMLNEAINGKNYLISEISSNSTSTPETIMLGSREHQYDMIYYCEALENAEFTETGMVAFGVFNATIDNLLFNIASELLKSEELFPESTDFDLINQLKPFGIKKIKVINFGYGFDENKRKINQERNRERFSSMGVDESFWAHPDLCSIFEYLPTNIPVRSTDNGSCFDERISTVCINDNDFSNLAEYTLFEDPDSKPDYKGQYPMRIPEKERKAGTIFHEVGHALSCPFYTIFEIIDNHRQLIDKKIPETLNMSSYIFGQNAYTEPCLGCKMLLAEIEKQIKDGIADVELKSAIESLKENLEQIFILEKEMNSSRGCLVRQIFHTTIEILQMLGFVVLDGVLYYNKYNDIKFYANYKWPIRTSHTARLIKSENLEQFIVSKNESLLMLKIQEVLKNKEMISNLAECFEKEKVWFIIFKNLGFDEKSHECMRLIFLMNKLDLKSYEEELSKIRSRYSLKIE